MRPARGIKAAALLLAGSLALAACASDEGGSGSATASSGSSGSSASGGSKALHIGIAYDTGGRGDKSFNDSAYSGVEQYQKDNPSTKITELSPNADASNRADLLTQLADEGDNPVIAVGYAFADALAQVAPNYPKTEFAIVDQSVADMKLTNATGLLFASNEGSFLGGVAAALKSTTGHVGFIGGVNVPLIQSFQAGFDAGAKAVKPNIVIDDQYISPAGDFSGYNDPARGKILAQGMYQAGADIVYAAAGGSGQGVFEAAADAGKRAIGVDSDQYQTVGDARLQAVIMTSVLKEVGTAVNDFVGDYAQGSVKGGSDITSDLKSGGVGLATSGGFIDDIQDQIKDYSGQITSGKITVPTTP